MLCAVVLYIVLWSPSSKIRVCLCLWWLVYFYACIMPCMFWLIV